MKSTNLGESKAVEMPQKFGIIREAENIGKDIFERFSDLMAGPNQSIKNIFKSINIFDRSFSVNEIEKTLSSRLGGDLNPDFIKKTYELFAIGDIIKTEIEQIKQQGKEFDREAFAKRISTKIENALAKNTYQLLKAGGLPSGLTPLFDSAPSTPPDEYTRNSKEKSGLDLLAITERAIGDAAKTAAPLAAIGAAMAPLDGGAAMAASGVSFVGSITGNITVGVAGGVAKDSVGKFRRESRESIRNHLLASIPPGIELESKPDGAPSPENLSRRASIDSESKSETQPLPNHTKVSPVEPPKGGEERPSSSPAASKSPNQSQDKFEQNFQTSIKDYDGFANILRQLQSSLREKQTRQIQGLDRARSLSPSRRNAGEGR